MTAAGVETAMVEMAPPGSDANHHLPSLTLLPGVYFNPGPEESVQTYLNRWIAGQEMPDIEGIIFEDDVYGDNPDALLRKYPPANIRNSDPKWWFLCECKLQATRGRSTRRAARRRVATGGYWKLEQTKKELLAGGGELLGYRRSFGFYHVGEEEEEKHDERKTRWLMEEYTSCSSQLGNDEGGTSGKNAMPALYKMYVSPHDPKKKRARDGEEDGVPMMGKTVRVMVLTAYFDAIAALLPPSSVRGVGHEQLQGTGEAPPLPPSFFGQFEGQFLHSALPMPPPPPGAPPLDVLGHCHGHYQYQGQFMEVTGEGDDASPDDHSMLVTIQFSASPEEQSTAEAPSPCVRSMDASPDDGSLTADEIFAMLEPLEEQGSNDVVGDCHRDLVPVNEDDIPRWQMMDGDALADISWIEDYINSK